MATVNSIPEHRQSPSAMRGVMDYCRQQQKVHDPVTLMLQNGVDIKTVSGMLGHYDAGFTLRTYTHTTNRQQAEAADMMGSLVAQSL
jgi:integrase